MSSVSAVTTPESLPAAISVSSLAVLTPEELGVRMATYALTDVCSAVDFS
jgi:hypothetical protein